MLLEKDVRMENWKDGMVEGWNLVLQIPTFQ